MAVATASTPRVKLPAGKRATREVAACGARLRRNASPLGVRPVPAEHEVGPRGGRGE